MKTPESLQAFIQQQQLPDSYLRWADGHFGPLRDALVQRARRDRPIVLGINGAQGSGKSTLAAWLQAALQAQGVASACLSLDDFYLSRAQRAALAHTVHPLLQTRGVPGTHDLALAIACTRALKAGQRCRLPRFDKAQDEPLPPSQWPEQAPVPVILLEGWCLGARPQPDSALASPVNALEAEQDPQGIWRAYVNQQLAGYQRWFAMVDSWAMLKAPDFSAVYHWRLQQERKLAAKHPAARGVMNEQQIAHFIAHYQRLTEWMLTEMPARVDYLYALDAGRNLISG